MTRSAGFLTDLAQAPDIPDITPGSPDEGNNYLGFLSLLRARLPQAKTLSIALPASFWYLKQYPVKDIGRYVDYFVYMTYDLHGQWGKFFYLLYLSATTGLISSLRCWQ